MSSDILKCVKMFAQYLARKIPGSIAKNLRLSIMEYNTRNKRQEVQSMEKQNEENKVYEDVFQELIDQFCIDNNIDDMRNASQSVWNSCLRNIYKHLFKNSDVLKSKEVNRHGNQVQSSNNNAYDINAVNDLLDIYIYDLCQRYDKEISIIGFSTLSGIENTTLHEWGNGNCNSELSKSRMNIYKKLYNFREESLSNKLATGNKNPVGILAILNRHYSWNLPGVSRETAPKQALTAADLPRLGASELHKNTTLPDNMQFDKRLTDEENQQTP